METPGARRRASLRLESLEGQRYDRALVGRTVELVLAHPGILGTPLQRTRVEAEQLLPHLRGGPHGERDINALVSRLD